jgi:hypothetical protein
MPHGEGEKWQQDCALPPQSLASLHARLEQLVSLQVASPDAQHCWPSAQSSGPSHSAREPEHVSPAGMQRGVPVISEQHAWSGAHVPAVPHSTPSAVLDVARH